MGGGGLIFRMLINWVTYLEAYILEGLYVGGVLTGFYGVKYLDA